MAIGKTIWILFRAATYATFFVSVLLVFLPSRVLAISGVTTPGATGLQQILGVILGVIGAALGTWCILTFVLVGRGTQAPFDPPRLLVVRGPYRALRNPMYAGASLALLGVALYYESIALMGYAVAFWLMTHFCVVLLEEPYLRRSFGNAYENYFATTARWWPRR
jgi:protein-S-isoprenylcysteine O-methyltransferase Ste14